MTDDWFGHRDMYGIPHGDKDEYTRWDYALINAYQTIESGTDSHGHLVWELDDEGASIIPVRKIDKHEAAVQRVTGGKNYKPAPGEYFVGVVKAPDHRDGVPQTWLQWQERIAQEAAEENG